MNRRTRHRRRGLSVLAFVPIVLTAGCSSSSDHGARASSTAATAAPPTTTTSISVTTTTPPSSTTTSEVLTTTTTAPPLPGIPPCTGGASILPAIRPPTVDVVCKDAAVSISGITWSSWDTFTAYGLGTAAVNDCQPDCATGTVQQYPASIYVFGPSEANTPVFHEITVTPTSTSGKVESSYLPGNWGVP